MKVLLKWNKTVRVYDKGMAKIKHHPTSFMFADKFTKALEGNIARTLK